MKNLFLVLSMSFFTFYSFGNTESLCVKVDCDSWASGFLEAYEVYNGCIEDAETYNTTYNNLVKYCEEK